MTDRSSSGRARLRRRLALGGGTGLAGAVLVLLLSWAGVLDVAEAKTYDARTAWLADPAAADSAIVVVAVDENSLQVYQDMLGRWPWPRDVYAAMLEYFSAGGARLAVFDITFPEPDLDAPLGDTLFAEALAATGLGTLPFTMAPGDSADAAEWERSLARIGGEEALRRRRAALERHALGPAPEPVRSYPYVEPPRALFAQAAAGLGSIVWNPDPDGVTRRERLVYAHRGELYPSLPLAAARLLAPDRYGGDVEPSSGTLRIGDTRVPLHRNAFLIRWRGPFLEGGESTYRVIPAFRILNSYNQVLAGRTPDVPLDELQGRIVFVATTAPGTFETRANPLSPDDPGVMIHATILDNLLRGDWLRRVGVGANGAMVLGAGLAAGLVSATLPSAVLGSIGALIVLVLAGVIATVAFAQGLWLDMAAPVLTAAVAYAGTMAGSYMTEGREKRRVRDLFGRYVTPDYVAQLADNFEDVELGGERIPLTLLFSDIRGFTSLSEKLPAETVIEMLNQYLDKMAEVVFRHGGTLDKFIGDAVMAFWGAPLAVEDHPRRAVEAALDMMDELEELNEQWSETGAPARLAIGIGVNTGEAIVGNIGSLSRKLDYTAIGDAVNLASRLEGLNKEYGTSIIVSETTASRLDADAYELATLDEVKVKGKEQAVRIFELKGRKARASKAGAGAGGAAPPAVGALLAGMLVGLTATGLAAQDADKARWTDWVYRPGAWQGGDFTEYVTDDAATDSLGLAARIEYYAMPPRWRAEVRTVVDGDSLAAPVVLVHGDDEVVVLTRLGSTPLSEHAAADDPLVTGAVDRMGPDGGPRPEPPARVVSRTASGAVAFVVVRRPAARAEFSESLLETGTAGRLGRSLARLGIHAIGGERREEVVASAGARGVAKVQTVDGEITVMPDTAAVLRMERVDVSLLELDRFLREARLVVPDETPRQEEGV